MTIDRLGSSVSAPLSNQAVANTVPNQTASPQPPAPAKPTHEKDYLDFRRNPDYEVAYSFQLSASDANGLSDRGSQDLSAQVRSARMAVSRGQLKDGVNTANLKMAQWSQERLPQSLAPYFTGFALDLKPQSQQQILELNLVNRPLALQFNEKLDQTLRQIQAFESQMHQGIDRLVQAIENPTGYSSIDSTWQTLRTYLAPLGNPQQIAQGARLTKAAISAALQQAKQLIAQARMDPNSPYAQARLVPGPGGMQVELTSQEWLNTLSQGLDGAFGTVQSYLPESAQQWVDQQLRSFIPSANQQLQQVSQQQQALITGSRDLLAKGLQSVAGNWGLKIEGSGDIRSWRLIPDPKMLPQLISQNISIGTGMNYRLTEVTPAANYRFGMGVTAEGALETHFENLYLKAGSYEALSKEDQAKTRPVVTPGERPDRFNLSIYGGIDTNEAMRINGKPLVNEQNQRMLMNRTKTYVDFVEADLNIDESEATATAALFNQPGGLSAFEGNVSGKGHQLKIETPTQGDNTQIQDDRYVPIYRVEYVPGRNSELAFDRLKVALNNGAQFNVASANGQPVSFQVSQRASKEKMPAGQKSAPIAVVDLPKAILEGQIVVPEAQIQIDKLKTTQEALLIVNPNHNADGQGTRIRFDGKTAQSLTFSGSLSSQGQQFALTDLNASDLEFDTKRQHLNLTRATVGNLQLPGGISASGVKANALSVQLDANQTLKVHNGQNGPLSVQTLNLGGDLTLNGLKIEGALIREGSRLTLNADQLETSGNSGGLQFQQLKLKGEAVIDTATQRLQIEARAKQSFHIQAQKLSSSGGDLPQVTLENFSLSGQKPPQHVRFSAAQREFSAEGKTPESRPFRLTVGEDLRLSQISGEGVMAYSPAKGLNLQGTYQASGPLSPELDAQQWQLGPQSQLNLNATGQLTIESPQSFKITAFQANQLQIGSLEGKGKLERHSAQETVLTGDVDAKNIQLKGEHVPQLSVKGGELRFEGPMTRFSAAQFDLTGQHGLKANGQGVNGTWQGTQYTLSAGKSPTYLDLPAREPRNMGVSALRFQGEAKLDLATRTLDLTPAETGLHIESGNIAGNVFNQVKIQGGQVHLTEAGDVSAAPLTGQKLSLSGHVQGLSLGTDSLFDGPVHFNASDKSVLWQDPARFHLQSAANSSPITLQTTGSFRMAADEQGRYVIQSEGGKLSGQWGGLALQDVEIQGKLIYDPRSGQLNFEGPAPGQDFRVVGAFNGRPLDLSGRGALKLNPDEQGWRIQAEGVQLKGLANGLSLASEPGIQAQALLRQDGSFALEGLSFQVKVHDLQLKQEKTLLTPLFNADRQLIGYELAMTGQIQSDMASLEQVLQIVGEQGPSADLRQSVQQFHQQLRQNLASFDASSTARYPDLRLRFDPQWQLQSYQGQAEIQLGNPVVKVNQVTHKPNQDPKSSEKTYPLQQAQNDMHFQSQAGQFQINQGELRFALDAKLRQAIGEQIKKELDGIKGLKDIQVSLSEQGEVDVQLKIKKGLSVPIKLQLDLGIDSETRQVVLKIDQVKLKGLLGGIIKRFIDEQKLTADELDRSLQALLGQETVERTERREIRINLGHLIRQEAGLELTSARFDQGKISLGYRSP